MFEEYVLISAISLIIGTISFIAVILTCYYSSIIKKNTTEMKKLFFFLLQDKLDNNREGWKKFKKEEAEFLYQGSDFLEYDEGISKASRDFDEKLQMLREKEQCNFKRELMMRSRVCWACGKNIPKNEEYHELSSGANICNDCYKIYEKDKDKILDKVKKFEEEHDLK